MTGEMIRQQREALGLTQAQLAVRAGISITAIANWEQSKSSPSAASATKLEEVFSGGGGSGFRPIEVRSVRQFEGVIDAPTFRKRFNLPDNASINITIPGLDNGSPRTVALELLDFEFRVSWTEEK